MKAVAEDPRFRIMHQPENATFTDLIAVLLSHGQAGRSVAEVSHEIASLAGSESGLARLDPERLKSIKGIGRARAASILAAIELARRFRFDHPRKGEKFSPDLLSRHLFERYRGIAKESLHIFSYNRNMRLIQHTPVSRGGVDSVSASYREIVRILLNDSARYALLAHNHPTDGACAGESDRIHTSGIERVLSPLGISLIDHYVCGADGIFSVKENKLIYTEGDTKKSFNESSILSNR